jgi:8-amino-7-oxononanoate synthase
MNLKDRWSHTLAELRAQGRYRTLAPPRGIDLSSNDYLGYGKRLSDESSLTGHQLSFSGGASRLLTGNHPIWEEVESLLARWHGAESTLMMTSGYAANEGLLATVIEPDDWVASDALNHASIIDGLRLARCERFVYDHCDLTHLETGMQAAAQARTTKRSLFVVTESLFGMDGDCAPLPELVDLADRYGAYVIMDEAHATGCFGVNGSGLVDSTGLRSRVLATVHTGGKALAVPGAYICGSRLLRELLINRCRHLIFTTAMPPMIGAWWLKAIQRVWEDHSARSRLHAAVATFRTACGRTRVRLSGQQYIAPVVIGPERTAMAAAHRLCNHGYDIRAIRPPSVPDGTARLRISIHADHGPEMLRELASLLEISARPNSPEIDGRCQTIS